MQITKKEIFQTVSNSPNDKHFIFACGEEIDDNDEWVKVTLDTELSSIEEMVEIPAKSTVFVIGTTDIESLSDIDKTIIDYCNIRKLNFAILSLSDRDIMQFFKTKCGYGIIFGDPLTNAFLFEILTTFKVLNIPYNIYK